MIFANLNNEQKLSVLNQVNVKNGQDLQTINKQIDKVFAGDKVTILTLNK